MTDHRGMYPKEFYFLIFYSITVFLTSETARPILPLHVTDLGASFVELGLIIGTMSVALIASKIPLGILADRAKPQTIMIGSALAQSTTQLLYSLAPDLAWFYPIRILDAISVASIIPLAIGRAQEFAPTGKTGETLGTFLTSYGIAITLGPFLCSTLLTQLNYVQVFQFISVIPILGILPFFAGMRFTRFQEKNNDASPVSYAFSYIFHSRNLVILTILRLLFALGYGFFVTYFIVYAEDTLLLAPFLIAFLLGIRGVIDMVLRVPVGRLADRMDTKYFILSGFSLLAIAYYLLSEVTEFYLLVLLMAMYGIALGFRVVPEWTLVAENSPEGCRSIIAAYLSTIFNIGSGFGVIIGGILATFIIIPDLFRISSVLMLLAVFITLFIQGKKDISLASEVKADDDVIDDTNDENRNPLMSIEFHDQIKESSKEFRYCPKHAKSSAGKQWTMKERRRIRNGRTVQSKADT